jgi:hypothetical protein
MIYIKYIKFLTEQQKKTQKRQPKRSCKQLTKNVFLQSFGDKSNDFVATSFDTVGGS